MSGEHMAIDYVMDVPPDGPWIIALTDNDGQEHIGPFSDSEEAIRWYGLHGDGQPVKIISLVHPDDYPGVQQAGPIPLPDPQQELPLDE